MNINVMGGKVHAFSCDTEEGLTDWIGTLQARPRLHPISILSSTQGCCKSVATGNKSPVPVSTRPKEEGVAASELTCPVHVGYCDVRTKSSWTRYWCAVDGNSLYAYHNQESQSPAITVDLRGML